MLRRVTFGACILIMIILVPNLTMLNARATHARGPPTSTTRLIVSSVNPVQNFGSGISMSQGGVYQVGDHIIVYWSFSCPNPSAGGYGLSLTFSGPDPPPSVNGGCDFIDKGAYFVGIAEMSDIGYWQVTAEWSEFCTPLNPGGPVCLHISTWQTQTEFEVIGTPSGGQADLTVDSCSVNPTNPTQGDTVTFSAHISNIGSSDANNFKLEVYLDGNLYDSTTLSLGAGHGGTASANTPWPAQVGSHTVRWVVNSDHSVQESNFANNEATCTFAVEPNPNREADQDQVLAKLWNFRADSVDAFVQVFEHPDVSAENQLNSLSQSGRDLAKEGVQAGLTGNEVDQFQYLLKALQATYNDLVTARANWEITIRLVNGDPSLANVISSLESVKSDCRQIAQAYENHNDGSVPSMKQSLRTDAGTAENALDSFLQAVAGRNVSPSPSQTTVSESVQVGDTFQIQLSTFTTMNQEIKTISIMITQSPQPNICWGAFWANYGRPSYLAYAQLGPQQFSFDMSSTDTGSQGHTASTVYSMMVQYSSDLVTVNVQSLGVQQWGFLCSSSTPIESATLSITIVVEYNARTVDQQMLQQYFAPLINDIKSTLQSLQSLG